MSDKVRTHDEFLLWKERRDRPKKFGYKLRSKAYIALQIEVQQKEEDEYYYG